MLALGPLAGCERVRDYLPDSLTGGADADFRAAAARSESEAVRAYYDGGGAALWTDAAGLDADGDALLARLCAAADEGLSPDDYDVEALNAAADAFGTAASDSAQARTRAALDVRLSEAFVAFASDLGRGRVRVRDLGGVWRLRSDSLDAGAALAAVGQDGLGAALAQVGADHVGYAGLRTALAAYRRIAAAGGWGTVAGPADDAGLRRRLAATSDLDSSATDVRAGVVRFQKRHGLDSTGVVDDSTLAALNVPVEARVAQIEANLERTRWMPAAYGDTYVHVNIPAFHLTAVEGGRPVMEMPVIVGDEANNTPVFQDTMQYVIFAPYWNVPESIQQEELLPRGGAYLARNGFERDGPTGLRQKPGPQNALGNVKFMFPNDLNIYLHDTPGKTAFDRSNRSLSHGCVRVAEPERLAAWVLGPNGDWNATRIAAAMDSTAEQRVDLKRRVPVYLTYLTAWASDDGTVQFRRDIYRQDPPLAAALARTRRQARAETPAVCRRPSQTPA